MEVSLKVYGEQEISSIEMFKESETTY